MSVKITSGKRMNYKSGGEWLVAFNRKTKKYSAEISFYGTGESFIKLYEITKEIYDKVDTLDDKSSRYLIETEGRRLYEYSTSKWAGWPVCRVQDPEYITLCDWAFAYVEKADYQKRIFADIPGVKEKGLVELSNLIINTYANEMAEKPVFSFDSMFCGTKYYAGCGYCFILTDTGADNKQELLFFRHRLDEFVPKVFEYACGKENCPSWAEIIGNKAVIAAIQNKYTTDTRKALYYKFDSSLMESIVCTLADDESETEYYFYFTENGLEKGYTVH